MPLPLTWSLQAQSFVVTMAQVWHGYESSALDRKAATSEAQKGYLLPGIGVEMDRDVPPQKANRLLKTDRVMHGLLCSTVNSIPIERKPGLVIAVRSKRSEADDFKFRARGFTTTWCMG